MTKKIKVGFYVITLAADGTARVTYSESGKLVFEGQAYDVARKLDELARSHEQAKLIAQRAAAKLREHTRVATHPWEVWRTVQWFNGDKLVVHNNWVRHASYKTRTAAERAAVKLAAKQPVDEYGESIGHPYVTEVRPAVAGSIL